MADPVLVQRATGKAATATVNCALASPTTAGNALLFRIASDDYLTGTPAGWTLPANGKQEGYHGGYFLLRDTPATPASSFSYTIGSASGSVWILEEWSGLDLSSVTAYGTVQNTSALFTTLPSFTTPAGDWFLAAMSGSSCATADYSTETCSFNGSFTTDATICNNLGGATKDGVSSGHQVVSGATSISAAASWTPLTSQSRSVIVVQIPVAASSGGTAVTGSLSATETGSDTAAFSGSVTAPAVSGAMAATETGSDTAAFSGSVEASGTLTAVETGSDTASFSGVVGASGLLATAEAGADRASFAGSVTTSGSLSASETGGDTAAFAGLVTVNGSLAAVEAGSDTAAFSGSVAPEGVTGVLAAVEIGLDVASFTGAASGGTSVPPSEWVLRPRRRRGR